MNRPFTVAMQTSETPDESRQSANTRRGVGSDTYPGDPSAHSAADDQASQSLDADVPEWMRWMSRIGFSAKGVVYLIVGALAMTGVATSGKSGALSEIASQSFGKIMLALVALGLFAYALWRLISGFVDPQDDSEDSAKGIGKRIGYVASGVAYTALGITAASIVLTAGSGSSSSSSGGSGGSGGASDWTAKLLDMPFGRWLVGAVALGVAIGAIYQLKQAIKAGFTDEFRQAEMSQDELTWATRAGRLGHTARAVVYAMITWFLARAALNANAEQAGGLAKALDTLQEQPYGQWLLIAAGLGFVCYGLYCFVVARYRRANA